MTVCVVALLKLTDAALYDRYRSRFVAVCDRYARRCWQRVTARRVEGEWDGDRIVLWSFPGADACLHWYGSPEHRAIARDRLAGAKSVILLAWGMDVPQAS